MLSGIHQIINHVYIYKVKCIRNTACIPTYILGVQYIKKAKKYQNHTVTKKNNSGCKDGMERVSPRVSPSIMYGFLRGFTTSDVAKDLSNISFKKQKVHKYNLGKLVKEGKEKRKVD